MQEELESLQTSYSSKQQQLNACTNQVTSLNAKIQRIESIIGEFTNFKSDLIDHRNDVKIVANKDYTYWQGDLFDNYHDEIKDQLVNDSLKEYIRSIDDNLDNLNNEKMRLENEVYSTEGLIGSIKSALNWLGTKIDNLLN
ncbi:DUF5082 family protein [Oceanobacillus bengalensis]|uniref:DUF5082 domain-containing protein n=1 Tax=Oceanobacillus bengalensis TaxID=1435466 RepID=A0A494Z4D5_9BACI|nr:DUF5082 family protein [Oceanobacillus bengalensis]RKQ16845.1 DUF5082 domain-containing protein [Oceanobacillus bengalensis]